jgi:hypothetical protein
MSLSLTKRAAGRLRGASFSGVEARSERRENVKEGLLVPAIRCESLPIDCGRSTTAVFVKFKKNEVGAKHASASQID